MTVQPVVGIAYKNFAAFKGISHIGLGVAAMGNTSVLVPNGIPASIFPVRHNIDLVEAIKEYNAKSMQKLTHVIISAPWLSIYDLRSMCKFFKNIQFLVVSHSNVGFLQADPQGTHLIREGLKLSRELPNFKIGGNSHKFCNWLRRTYSIPVICVPNLYPFKPKVKTWNGKSLKIGIFGAIRPQKNMMTAAAGALLIARELNIPTELYMNSGREEGVAAGVLTRAINQMCSGIDNFKVIQTPWALWNKHREVVGQMDLLIQVSYTESFNMVTADGIAMGVPSVVSSAINWAPDSWKADADDAVEVARIGIRLLKKKRLRKQGIKLLKRHNEKGLRCWLEFLYGRPETFRERVLRRMKQWLHEFIDLWESVKCWNSFTNGDCQGEARNATQQ